MYGIFNTYKVSMSSKKNVSAQPIMQLLDLMGRRWAMRIVWELRKGPMTFRQLQEVCGNLSPTVLNQRLKELTNSMLVTRANREGYKLSEFGVDLLQAFEPLGKWTTRWARVTGSQKSRRNLRLKIR